MHLDMSAFSKNKRRNVIILVFILGILLAFVLAIILAGKKNEGAGYTVDTETLDAEADTYNTIEGYQNKLEQANPLIQYLPFKSEGGKFEISYGLEDQEALKVSYLVIMYPRSTPNSDFYGDEIEKIKKDATLWLERNLVPTLPDGENLSSATIKWKLAGN